MDIEILSSGQYQHVSIGPSQKKRLQVETELTKAWSQKIIRKITKIVWEEIVNNMIS